VAPRLTDYLDQQESAEEPALIQGYVPSDLRAEVAAQMKTDKKNGIKITWDNFIEAACLTYLAERKLKEKKS
jgi:hypothetical protein